MYSFVNFSERDICHAGVLLVPGDVLPDGMQQVGLAQSNTAIQKQRVIGFAGRLGYS